MGAAAGAHIRAGELGDPHGALQRLLAAVGQILQILLRRPPDPGRVVLLYVAVGLPLDLQHALPGDFGVIVDGHHVGTHMEAHVVAVIRLAQHAGDDMLTGVLLHVVKAPGPIDAAHHRGRHHQRMGHGVIDDAVFLLHVQHRLAA